MTTIEEVNDWFSKESRRISTEYYISMDIDFGFDTNPVDAVSRSIKLFVEFVGRFSDFTNYKPLLVIPLSMTNMFSNEVISFDRCVEFMSDEPPSIYVVQRDGEKRLTICEEYRKPIESPIESNNCPRGVLLYSYYRIFRNINSMLNDWEYTRCIYLEAWPEELCNRN